MSQFLSRNLYTEYFNRHKTYKNIEKIDQTMSQTSVHPILGQNCGQSL